MQIRGDFPTRADRLKFAAIGRDIAVAVNYASWSAARAPSIANVIDYKVPERAQSASWRRKELQRCGPRSARTSTY